jgi:putative pyruvate formate lyase activating enzyme
MDKSILNLYKNCGLCPRQCNVNRQAAQTGFCKAGSEAVVALYMPHRFEEPPINGTKGSGTIFFSYCTGRCHYCQNYNFSRGKTGKVVSAERLSDIMLLLQEKGCHNINLVSPTHYVPSIIIAIDMARARSLDIPILYNTGGYESIETIGLLKGYVDIYLADAKYSDNLLAQEQCEFIRYSTYNIAALKKMHQQVGNLKIDNHGIAQKGLLIRHLVIPGYIENTKNMLDLIAKNLSNDIYISLMSQYAPIKQVRHDSNLGRRLNKDEYNQAKDYVGILGFSNGWIQDFFE